MTEYDFLLQDRIQKIQSINNLYDLLNKSYLSFSGGKDSTVLHYLMDYALPGNKIPRVYINTGIEYKSVVSYVEKMMEVDDRIIIIKSGVNIKKMLEDKGYPMKSKEHSEKLSYYQNSGMTKTVSNYLGLGDKKNFLCSKKLRYQFSPEFKIKVSKKCCDVLKKNVIAKWGKENNKSITITGMRREEGGLRKSLKACTIFDDLGLKKFHPLLPLPSKWLDDFIKNENIRLCDLYYPPFNFERTGCAGCPYNPNLQKELDLLSIFLPAERKKCEIIWDKVYSEYRRIGYRLDSEKSLFD